MPEGPSPAREISASITTLLVYTFAHSKGGFMSEDTGGILHCQNKYSKSG